MKTNSGAKKRFKVSKSGLVIATQTGKRHNMRKRSREAIRNQRGTVVLAECVANVVRKRIPYGLRKKK